MTVEPLYHLIHRSGLLQIHYNIKDRIELEQKNKDLSKELFGDTVKDFITDISNDKDFVKDKLAKEWIKVVKKMLESANKH